MASTKEILDRLVAKARPDQVAGMARYGMTPTRRLGVSVPELRRLAKEIGRDHGLAIGLWKSGIPEARIVAAMIDDPHELTAEQMDEWAGDLDSWDVCDQVCMNLFEKTPLAWVKIGQWAEREEEFAKRAAFALIACLAWHDKEAPDERFIALLPILKQGATDERNYVKKAVSWALRHIGKRNPDLNRAAIEAAHAIRQIDSRSARWIAADAIKELESDAVQKRLSKR